MQDDLQHDEREGADLARLLEATGPRSKPSDRAMAEVRAAVEAEWREVVSKRQQRRRYTTWALAAGIAVAAVGAWLARPLYLQEPGPIASLARVVGDVQMDTGNGRWSTLATGSVVTSGSVIRTLGGGRAALRMNDGVELRLDSGTELAFNDANDARLASGAVYVDSGPEVAPPAADFVLETPAGSVRHLGTQYEARLTGGDVLVGIREGRVEVSGQRGTVLGNAGEVLKISDGGVSRSPLAPSASQWNWVGEVTPPFSIEGRSVDAFLAWAGRESGRRVVYASPDVERQANIVTLSGTVEGLAPNEAVAAVLSTTSLRPVVTDGEIRILSANP
jgi:ferric-dicitrate binding protein FerR (iron transport regulator)